MNGWGVAILTALVASVWIMWQNDRMEDMRRDVVRMGAILDGIAAQRQNNERFDGIDRDLKDGGEDDLSDYMRGAADKLWPSP